MTGDGGDGFDPLENQIRPDGLEVSEVSFAMVDS